MQLIPNIPKSLEQLPYPVDRLLSQIRIEQTDDHGNVYTWRFQMISADLKHLPYAPVLKIAEGHNVCGTVLMDANCNIKEVRWRMATMLGHVLLGHSQTRRLTNYEVFEARLFAAALLVPLNLLAKTMNQRYSLEICSDMFGVPLGQMRYWKQLNTLELKNRVTHRLKLHALKHSSTSQVGVDNLCSFSFSFCN